MNTHPHVASARLRPLLAALLALSLAACGGGDDGGDTPAPGATPATTAAPAGGSPVANAACTDPTAPSDLDADLIAVLQSDIARAPEAPGEYMAVRAPSLGLSFAAAISPDGAPLDPRAPFRIASNTKTFTAAAILRLAETEKLKLDDPIAMHVSEDALTLLNNDGYDTDAITVRHMLHHVSGLYDYATDPSYEGDVIGDPGHRWTRIEQVTYAMDRGDPLGPPGEVFEYSDTGYVLLGEIIERTTGLSLAESYRTLLRYDDLGMKDTYLESLEAVPPGAPARAPQFFGTLDATTLLDPSFDLYGGGGLVSTVDDLSRFYCALFSGQVFDDPETIDIMVAPPPNAEAGSAVGTGIAMGLFEYEIENVQCWGHSGFWGSSVMYCPAPGITIARTLNQATLSDDFDDGDLSEDVIVLLQ